MFLEFEQKILASLEEVKMQQRYLIMLFQEQQAQAVPADVQLPGNLTMPKPMRPVSLIMKTSGKLW